MAITYVNGDISTSDNVSTVTGVSWTGLGHASGDVAVCIWALLQTATTVTLDSDLTSLDNHVDQNLRSILSDRSMTGSESGTLTFSVDAGSLNRMAVALGIWRGVGTVGTPVRFTEGGTAVDLHPAANNLSITPTADNALILLVYSERSSTGNTAGTLAPPTGPGGGAATIRVERGTGNSGGTYVQIAEFQLGAGTAGNAQAFTQWNATPDTLIASNADMWLIPLYPPAGTDATPTPAVLGSTVSAPQATPAVDDSGTPAETQVMAATPQAGVSVSAVPSVTASVVSLPPALPSVSDSAAPAAFPVVVGLPQATPLAGGNATVNPAVITSVAALPAATPSGAGRSTPTVLSATVALPQALPIGAASARPAVLSAFTGAPAASPMAGASRTPSVITSVVGFPQVVRSAGAAVSPGLLQVLLAFPQASGPSPVFSPLIDPVLSLRANSASLGLRANSASVSVRPNNAEAS